MNDAYEKLRDEVDRLSRRLSDRYAGHLVCGAGCSGCCRHHLSVFNVEADIVRRAVDELPDDLRRRIRLQAEEVDRKEALGEEVSCPLLVDDRCAIYDSRPLICRTQGLPLLFEGDDGEQEVDFCPLNFSAPGAIDDLAEDHLVPLDSINLKLAVANLEYCLESGLDKSRAGERAPLSGIVREEGEKK